jgi:hypothetical protein
MYHYQHQKQQIIAMEKYVPLKIWPFCFD